jgi:membrane protein YdbS with pleckstrin-like domain
MTTNKPFDLRIKSFVSFDDAVDLCALLHEETGRTYKVVPDNHLGFSFIRKAENNQAQAGTNESQPGNVKSYRQDLRGFIPQYLQMVLGLFVMIQSAWVIELVLIALEIDTVPKWLNVSDWILAVRYAGLALFLYGLRFIYRYYAALLFFDDDGVILRKGIIAQNQIQIRFGDIKTIGVHQGIMERILGIGTLELDSAGTDGVDITFKNIINPIAQRRKIQGLIFGHTRR